VEKCERRRENGQGSAVAVWNQHSNPLFRDSFRKLLELGTGHAEKGRMRVHIRTAADGLTEQAHDFTYGPPISPKIQQQRVKARS
jgi:hypothetical protein